MDWSSYFYFPVYIYHMWNCVDSIVTCSSCRSQEKNIWVPLHQGCKSSSNAISIDFPYPQSDQREMRENWSSIHWEIDERCYLEEGAEEIQDGQLHSQSGSPRFFDPLPSPSPSSSRSPKSRWATHNLVILILYLQSLPFFHGIWVKFWLKTWFAMECSNGFWVYFS